MFIITWLFDKLGYMPKVNVEVGTLAAWPFPVEVEKPKTQGKKKPAAKKPALKKATTRKPKAK